MRLTRLIFAYFISKIDTKLILLKANFENILLVALFKKVLVQLI